MAISQDQMYWRFGDIMLNQNGLYVRWEVYHPTTATIIQAGTVNVPAAKASDLTAAWNTAQGLINSAVSAVYARHAAVPAIQDYSRFDANLILDSWLSDPVSGTLVHPISGTFESVVYDGLVGLVNAILDRVPGPPIWAWAEAGDAGRLRVRCIAVPGADSYNVHNHDVLLGSVPSASWNELAVPAGSYNVRIAAVDAGQVGICSFPIPVTVS